MGISPEGMKKPFFCFSMVFSSFPECRRTCFTSIFAQSEWMLFVGRKCSGSVLSLGA